MKLSGQNQLKLLFFCDENLTWKPHIKYIENKIEKNIGSLFKTRPFQINNPFYFYNIRISIATLSMPTSLGKGHI